MMYVDFEAKGINYKLRLNTRNTVNLERQLGCNPLSIFDNEDTIPTVTTMVQVLYASLLQFNHGLNLNDAYDIFDDWLADGHVVTDFLHVIVDIFKVSGIIKDDKRGNEEKN